MIMNTKRTMFACRGRLFCGICGEIFVMPFEGVMDHMALHWFNKEIGGGDPQETLDFVMMPASVDMKEDKELPPGWTNSMMKLADAKSMVIKSR